MRYIKKCMEGILLTDSTETVVQSSLRKYLDTECLKYGSSYDGRISSVKFLSERKGLVPLYVNPEVLLLFTSNIRNWDIVLVNYHRTLSIREYENNQVLVVFEDLKELVLNVSFKRFKKQYDIAQSLITVIF